MGKYSDGENNNRIWKALLHTLIALYGLSMVFLFYKQTGWSGGSIYESDLPAHIKMIVEDGWYYSLTALVYQSLYRIPFTLPDGAPFGNLGIAVFLALCGWLTVYLTAFLLRDMQGQSGKLTALHLLGGLILNFVMPCYVRGIADGRYIGMESASIWHNSTYIVMKTAGLFCILYYGKLERKYRQGLSGKQWICFTLLLSLCTGVKPSFLMVFAPMMAVFLLIDLLKKTPFSRVFVFGASVFLPLIVVFVQNTVLFGAETGNGWEIRPGYVLSLHSGHPLISAVLSVLFPCILLPVFWKELRKDRWFSGAWLMAAFGFLELFLFSETGNRTAAGNFMWGYSFSILMIFAAALVKWFERGKRLIRGEKSREYYLNIGVLGLSGLVLCWHLYCGLYFYINLLHGVSYFMWR